MNDNILAIPLPQLALAFVPVAVVIVVLWRWSLDWKNAVYAVLRMLLQLMLIGYVLVSIFEAKESWIVIGVLTVMLVASSWIALRTVSKRQPRLFGKVLLSIAVSGIFVLLLITQVVLQLEPWFMPRYMIPLAGMIFANAMNAISLAAERLESELQFGAEFAKAKGVALRASLIPITNALFAVGLVSLPGMMTGQILSGVSPLMAARYQIVVMCMIFGAVGMASALFLSQMRHEDGETRDASNKGLRKAG